MGVEGVSREIRKALDVRNRDLALPGVECVADLKCREWLTEGMYPRIQLRGSFHPPARYSSNHTRCALHGSALHVVQHPAHPAQLFTAPRTPRATVYQMRQWRSVTGGFLRAMAVDHE